MSKLIRQIRQFGSKPVSELFTSTAIPGIPVDASLQRSAQMLFELAGHGAIVADGSGNVVYLNAVAERFTGVGMLSAAGQPLAEVARFVNPKNEEPIEVPLRKVLMEARAMFLPDYTTMVSATGRQHSVDGNLAPISSADGRVLGVLLSLQDVSRYRQLTDTLSVHANQDPLTGLTNRREFELRVGRAIKRTKSHGATHALAFMDLDKFKIVNDLCGHAAGDELLKTIAAALRTRIRERDTLARLGGDEFALLLENCALPEAMKVCQDLVEAVGAVSFRWEDRTFTVGVSIGLSSIESTTADFAAAASITDRACYVAKQNGRNRVELASEAPSEAVSDVPADPLSAANLIKALETGAFSLSLEPLAPVAGTGHQDHFQISCAMRVPGREPIPAVELRGSSDRYQLTSQIDRWIIRTAFEAHGRQWSDRPAKERAVWLIPLSTASLTTEGFAGFIAEQARANRISPANICLEIEEATAVSHTALLAEFVWSLRIDGFRFGLSQVGRHLGAMPALRQFPIDYLKIDPALVRDATSEPLAMGMVESICHIGRIMRARTVATNVETFAQLTSLQAVGVDFAVGPRCGAPAQITPPAIPGKTGR